MRSITSVEYQNLLRDSCALQKARKRIEELTNRLREKANIIKKLRRENKKTSETNSVNILNF